MDGLRIKGCIGTAQAEADADYAAGIIGHGLLDSVRDAITAVVADIKAYWGSRGDRMGPFEIKQRFDFVVVNAWICTIGQYGCWTRGGEVELGVEGRQCAVKIIGITYNRDAVSATPVGTARQQGILVVKRVEVAGPEGFEVINYRLRLR